MLDDNEILTAIQGLGCLLRNFVAEGTINVHGFRVFGCKALTEYPDLH
jgi:hypothetical protein